MNENADRIERLRRGNTDLLEALMDMVNQFFYAGQDGLLRHTFMAAEEEAIDVLIDAGFAEEENGGYKLLWHKLAARRLEIDGRSTPAGLPDDRDEVDAAHWDAEEFL